MKKFIWPVLGALSLFCQMAIAELKPHSDHKSTYVDIINNTDYFVWLTDIEQFNLPGHGTRTSRKISINKPFAPKSKETESWKGWASGAHTIFSSSHTGAKIYFGTQNNYAVHTGHAFNIEPEGVDQEFDVTIAGRKVKMRLQIVGHEKPPFVVGRNARLVEYFDDYTITITQVKPAHSQR